MDKLILVLEYEALIMESSYPCVDRYQHNKGIAELLADLVNKHAVYHSSETKLLFIGDILHDRLSCNKTAVTDLIVKLYKIGVIFILGNHDVYRESYTPEGKCLGEGGQFGEYAADKSNKTWDEWQEFEKKYFVNCYYDDKRKCFFIHNGIVYDPAKEGCKIYCIHNKKEVYRGYDIAIFSDRENIQPNSLWFRDEDGDAKEFDLKVWPELKNLVDNISFERGIWREADEKIKSFLDSNKKLARAKGLHINSFGYYKTALGDIEANDINELCNKINCMVYKPRDGWFTDFRPEDGAMSENNGLFSENEITIVHGHHGFFDGDYNAKVININSRLEKKFSTDAVFL